MLTDTHTHLFHKQFQHDIADVIGRARDQGVTRFFLPNIDQHSVQHMLDLVDKFPSSCFPMLGVHPCSIEDDWKSQLEPLRKLLYESPDRFVAVGEIGIDLYWDKSTLPQQMEAFQEQIRWSLELNKPVVIHSRDSFDEVFAGIEAVWQPGFKGILHCFTGGPKEAQKALDLGLHLGIGGVVTYKNTDLRETLVDVPLERLVLETDSPYLAPIPFRGRRNESAYLVEVAHTVAEVKNLPFWELAEITTENSKALFGV